MFVPLEHAFVVTEERKPVDVTRLTDKELARACALGNTAAQARLYEVYSSALMALCVRYASCVQEAEDILQDGFIKIYRKIDQFQGDCPLYGWLRKVMVNVAIDFQRHKNRKAPKNDYSEEELGNLPSMDVSVINHIASEDLVSMINKLPHPSKSIFNLHAIEGYTHDEISEMLNIPVGTSKSYLYRARLVLQKEVLRHCSASAINA
jgi:RNA polymerase sigma factor (sigma-70 family)